MKKSFRRRGIQALFLIALGGGWLVPLVSDPSVEAQATATTTESGELAKLFEQDQADRRQGEGKSIDWTVVSKRDAARLARVKEFYTGNGLQTGADHYYAAMVLQHSSVPEDFLLAHELCVIAIGKGEERAKWLAAASEDRFLMNINRPQRFGTQFRSNGPGTPWRLYEVDPGVTDALRSSMNVPTLAAARKREAEMNQHAERKQ
jgi:hypothetical protein